MQTYTIPDGFIGHGNDVGPGIYIHPYTAPQGAVKNKVTITKVLINFPLEGEKHIYFPDRTVSVQSSQAVMIPSGNCLMTEKISLDTSYKCLLFFLDKKHIADFLLQYHEAKKPETANTAIAPCFTFIIDDYVKGFILSLENILQRDGKITSNMASLKLSEILLYLGERYGAPFISFLTHIVAHPAELSFRKVVEDNMYANLTLDEIAFLCSMSLATFKRQFAKIYGTAPNRWFHDKRMKRAEFLLSQQKARPSDIYFELGYENLSSFTSAFKKEFGTTPKKYQPGK